MTTKKPLHAATLNTLSRWVKSVLGLAGIDISRFGPGSVRAAATSTAKAAGAPIDAIMASAGWSRSTTFSRFYDKPLISNYTLDDFVLDKYTV